MNTSLNTQSLVIWNYTGSDNNGYLLERSLNSGATWTHYLSCSAATTSFLDNNVWWYTSSWYRVSALNPYGQSPHSSIAPVFIQPPVMDIPSVSGSQIPPLQESASLSWSFSGSSQGLPDQLIIERSADGGATWGYSVIISNPVTGSSSFVDTSVMYGNSYSYRMRAHADYGLYGDYSVFTASVYIDVPPTTTTTTTPTTTTTTTTTDTTTTDTTTTDTTTTDTTSTPTTTTTTSTSTDTTSTTSTDTTTTDTTSTPTTTTTTTDTTTGGGGGTTTTTTTTTDTTTPSIPTLICTGIPGLSDQFGACFPRISNLSAINNFSNGVVCSGSSYLHTIADLTWTQDGGSSGDSISVSGAGGNATVSVGINAGSTSYPYGAAALGISSTICVLPLAGVDVQVDFTMTGNSFLSANSYFRVDGNNIIGGQAGGLPSTSSVFHLSRGNHSFQIAAVTDDVPEPGPGNSTSVNVVLTPLTSEAADSAPPANPAWNGFLDAPFNTKNCGGNYIGNLYTVTESVSLNGVNLDTSSWAWNYLWPTCGNENLMVLTGQADPRYTSLEIWAGYNGADSGSIGAFTQNGGYTTPGNTNLTIIADVPPSSSTQDWFVSPNNLRLRIKNFDPSSSMFDFTGCTGTSPSSAPQWDGTFPYWISYKDPSVGGLTQYSTAADPNGSTVSYNGLFFMPQIYIQPGFAPNTWWLGFYADTGYANTFISYVRYDASPVGVYVPAGGQCAAFSGSIEIESYTAFNYP